MSTAQLYAVLRNQWSIIFLIYNYLRSDVLVSVKSRINVLSKAVIEIGSIKNAQKNGYKNSKVFKSKYMNTYKNKPFLHIG